MIKYIKKYLIKRPSIHDIICYVVILLMKNKSNNIEQYLILYKN